MEIKEEKKIDEWKRKTKTKSVKIKFTIKKNE